MKIEREYAVAQPNKKGPYKFYGRFICHTDDESTNNLIAMYAEEYWIRQGGDDFAVSFVPSLTDGVAFWINAATKRRVKDFMDYSINLLIKGLVEEHGIPRSSIEDKVNAK